MRKYPEALPPTSSQDRLSAGELQHLSTSRTETTLEQPQVRNGDSCSRSPFRWQLMARSRQTRRSPAVLRVLHPASSPVTPSSHCRYLPPRARRASTSPTAPARLPRTSRFSSTSDLHSTA